MRTFLKIILIVVLLGICVTALAFAIKGTDNAETVPNGYTDEDLQKSYEQGYKDANADKDELEAIRIQNTALIQESQKLTSENNSLTEQVNNLTRERDNLQQQKDLLQTQDEENVAEINRLNVQITNLNMQIAELNNQIISNNNSVASLNNRIAELQKTIAFYEQFVVQFETDDQALVTFEFSGSVYDGKVVNKGDRVATTPPTSTEYVIFNYWTVDGERIDLNTYTVTQSVRIVADVTYKYIVNFNVENTTKYTQVVEKGQCPTYPSPNPRKSGFTFKYWTLDGENQVDVEQCIITANTTFIAKFVELFTVTFEVNGEIKANRRVEKGAFTTPLTPEIPENMEFLGWTLNDIVIDVAHYKIEADTNFVAKFRDVTKIRVNFYTKEIEDVAGVPCWNEKWFSSQEVIVDTSPIYIEPSRPTGCWFKGWTLNGTDVIDITKYKVTTITTFKPVYNFPSSTFTVKFMSSNGKTVLSTQTVKYGQSPNNVTPDTDTVSGSGWTGFFRGWSTTKNNTNDISQDYASVRNMAVNRDLILYPIYNPTIIA